MNAPITDINHNGLSGWINISMLIRTSHLKINIKNIECSPKNQEFVSFVQGTCMVPFSCKPRKLASITEINILLHSFVFKY